jgi:hypothetical protein
MARKRSEQEQELMTDANIQRCISLLEPKDPNTKPISKKDACQILGMAYNTTRLANILQEFKDKQARDAQRRAEKRGKPVTKQEIEYIITEYLSGESLDNISKSIYRGTQLIKQVLEDYSVPIRQSGHSYFKPELIPEGATRDRFSIGEVVYSARYDSLAKINVEQQHKDGWVYRMWLLSDKWQQFCWQPAYELASLEPIRQAGIKV